MAQGVLFRCTNCDKTIESWDDGNPYYRDERGRKKYAYHPSSERELCVGNDSPHLCLSCGKTFMVDSQQPIEQCPKCQSNNIAPTYHLQGEFCPFCKAGHFERDPDFWVIS